MRQEIPLYHFHAWSDYYGWQHLGATDGYMTYEECYNDNLFHIKDGGRIKWQISKLQDADALKSEVVE